MKHNFKRFLKIGMLIQILILNIIIHVKRSSFLNRNYLNFK